MSNVFKEQTPAEFDEEKIHELFPVEELEEALAQIERGEIYTIDEVEAELEEKFAKEYGGEFSYGNDRLSKNKSA